MGKTKKFYGFRHSPKKTLKFLQEHESCDMSTGEKLEISFEVMAESSLSESGEFDCKINCSESCSIGLSYLGKILRAIFKTTT